ncbi:MAG: BrnT family toxin [Ardenticatenaceae bacterium]
MKFQWDENKRISNLAKHRLDFEDAHLVFNDESFFVEDDRYQYYETRFILYGTLLGRVVVVVFSMPDDDVVRIISMRKATKRERKSYYQKLY